jgi:hypothetical protein
MQVLFDLPAFITMLARFFRLVIHFSEGMFGIANGVSNNFQRFGHSLSVPLFNGPGVKDALARLPWSGLRCLMMGIGCFKRYYYKTVLAKIHSNFIGSFADA